MGSDAVPDLPTKARRPVKDVRYRVKVLPYPIVVDAAGMPVSDAHVVSIRFPRTITSTSAGQVPVISGRGVARIVVGKTAVRGVPLC